MPSDWEDNTDGRIEDEELHAIPPVQNQQSQIVMHPHIDQFPQDEDDVSTSSEPSLTRLEAAWGGMRRFSPILAPLLFGGVTFLFILPFVLNMRANLSTSGLPVGLILLVVGFVLLAFAVGQGMMLYYAGGNDVFWSLGMICGFSLFLLTGCFVIFGLVPSLILLAVLLAVGFVLTRLYIHSTPEGRVDIVEAFGKYSRTLSPGPNFVAPWERIVHELDTREIVWPCPKQQVLVSRSEEVHLAASISYQLLPEDAHLAALYVNNWQKALQDLFIATMQNVVEQLSPDDFIAWSHASFSRQMTIGGPHEFATGRWDSINSHLTHVIQDQVAHWGVQINWARLRDVTVVPHIPTFADTKSVASPQLVDAGATRGTTAATGQVHQARVQPRQTEQATLEKAPPPPVAAPAPVLPTPPVPSSTDGLSPQVNKAATLKEAYVAVRSNRITDPTTIRSIAARFEAIANNPEASKTVDFDAVRAAQALHERAKVLEEQAMASAAEEEDDTQLDWSVRRPSDDNLLAGG